MRKRLEKKREKRIRKDIHKALDMVLDINGLEMRQEEMTGNLPTAFLNFEGHTASVDVAICTDGWSPFKQYSPKRSTCWSLDRMGELLAWLEGMKKELGC